LAIIDCSWAIAVSGPFCRGNRGAHRPQHFFGLVRLSDAGQENGQRVTRLEARRAQRHQTTVFPFSQFVSVQCRGELGEYGVKLDTLRVGLDCRFQERDGLFMFAARQMQTDCQIGCIDMAWVIAQHRPRGFHGRVVIAFAALQRRLYGPRVGVAGIGTQQRVIEFLGFFRRAGEKIKTRQPDARLDQCRIKFDRPLIAAEGFLIALARLLDLAGERIAQGMIGIDLQDVADFDAGLVVISGLVKTLALVEVRLQALLFAVARSETDEQHRHSCFQGAFHISPSVKRSPFAQRSVWRNAAACPGKRARCRLP
jgi:hypothetical protein